MVDRDMPPARKFEEIIEQNKGILFKVARTYCQDDRDRQDLIQEMMLQIWRSLPKYKQQYAMSTWLYRIALNVAISFYRKHANQHAKLIPISDSEAFVPTADPTDQEQQLQQLDQFIAELNDFDKALMILYLEDKSHAEIADILGISVSNVATKVGRIKEKLKKRFSHSNT